MDNKTKKIIEQSVSDAMIEKPIELKIGEQDYQICPPSFGKMQILSKFFLQLDMDEEKLNKEPHLESMRVCMDKTDIVCSMIAVATMSAKEDLQNTKKIAELAEKIKWEGKPSDFAKVMLAILTQVDYSNFTSSIILTKILRQNKPREKGTNMVE